MSPRMRKWIPWISTAASIVVLIIIWKLVIAIFDVSPFVLPQPEDVVGGVRDLVQEDGFWTDVRITLTETLVGFGIAILSSASASARCWAGSSGSSRRCDRSSSPRRWCRRSR